MPTRSSGPSRRTSQLAHALVTASLGPCIDPERSSTSASFSGARSAVAGAFGAATSSMTLTVCSSSTASRLWSSLIDPCISCGSMPAWYSVAVTSDLGLAVVVLNEHAAVTRRSHVEDLRPGQDGVERYDQRRRLATLCC